MHACIYIYTHLKMYTHLGGDRCEGQKIDIYIYTYISNANPSRYEQVALLRTHFSPNYVLNIARN